MAKRSHQETDLMPEVFWGRERERPSQNGDMKEIETADRLRDQKTENRAVRDCLKGISVP